MTKAMEYVGELDERNDEHLCLNIQPKPILAEFAVHTIVYIWLLFQQNKALCAGICKLDHFYSIDSWNCIKNVTYDN